MFVEQAVRNPDPEGRAQDGEEAVRRPKQFVAGSPAAAAFQNHRIPDGACRRGQKRAGQPGHRRRSARFVPALFLPDSGRTSLLPATFARRSESREQNACRTRLCRECAERHRISPHFSGTSDINCTRGAAAPIPSGRPVCLRGSRHGSAAIIPNGMSLPRHKKRPLAF